MTHHLDSMLQWDSCYCSIGLSISSRLIPHLNCSGKSNIGNQRVQSTPCMCSGTCRSVRTRLRTFQKDISADR